MIHKVPYNTRPWPKVDISSLTLKEVTMKCRSHFLLGPYLLECLYCAFAFLIIY